LARRASALCLKVSAQMWASPGADVGVGAIRDRKFRLCRSSLCCFRALQTLAVMHVVLLIAKGRARGNADEIWHAVKVRDTESFRHGCVRAR
jgi:hypothetical protein